MASVFGHSIVAIAFGNSFSKKLFSFKFWFLGILCTILPDIDVVGFSFGIAYEDLFGHRGFTHSIFFALITGVLFSYLFYYKQLKTNPLQFIGIIFYFFMCAVSHGILDAMTTGGLGVAFFSPWDPTRYFFPWRPIEVSPIRIARFFTERGLTILANELLWIGIPCLLYFLGATSVKLFFMNRRKGN